MDLVPSQLVAANEVDLPAGRFAFWHEPSDFPMPDNSEQLLAEVGQDNPLIRHYAETGDGSARKFSDLVSQEELHRTRFYREFYSVVGLEYQMSVTLPAQAPRIFAVVCGASDKDFDEKDRQILNRIRPHLSQLWRGVRDLDRLRAIAELSEDVAVAQGWGAVVLGDPPHEIIPNSLVTLYRDFGRPSRDSPFSLRVQRWIADQRARLSSGAPLSLFRPLRVRAGGRTVVLRYLPPGRARSDAIVIETSSSHEPHNLKSLGLTEREADVVHLVLAGVTNRQIAERLQMATGTVHKHLDNVYRKLGVHSRGALTALVLDITGET
ncbi:MAG TPA: LuxR C-terminal-related transcriptional regulator [Acidimicrobiales bacterium]|jgi:DNA-binding CsgD family transcriptional regulator|nr:LuxR C-terminal-related transcriptional regulator [Acidimicrobiales bacterium]